MKELEEEKDNDRNWTWIWMNFDCLFGRIDEFCHTGILLAVYMWLFRYTDIV